MGKRHSERDVNPPFHQPFIDYMSKGELLEYHSKYGDMASFYDLYPESKPSCAGIAGCGCPACCRQRGQRVERER